MYFIQHKTDAFQVFQSIGAAREHIATFKRERDAKAFTAIEPLQTAAAMLADVSDHTINTLSHQQIKYLLCDLRTEARAAIAKTADAVRP